MKSYRDAITAVFGSGLMFGAFGFVVGFLLGKFLPDYYRTVFSSGSDPDFNAVAVGIGQGVTQGFAAGIVVGIVIVLIKAFVGRDRPGTNATDD
ncbi:hypothetical protein HAHE_25880 [Haloferula helveola]|uniref:Uncharacterized protein n=1 Tax=Haloferula helveola TaxID=490095 RepID=A0ABN6HB47_9BACT|nr:hypothetical protein HAHE_25880 [Haloferula helveola]